ncbi:hypothetical protein [Deinococcus radiodurans]|jgi:hypothetical protein|uniref:hypothetical protein n=1 Tax=Deinococcus radiodurans TaxID=1299 RepID=UPI0004840177|nr:hypothetical protein [Deinococcus radiodurans]ANC72963.1 hypothetical protein A2G07_14005 [Deinococcus radiodurans R1 = ATCC 13939 = DSM 20539]QIP30397.1 hypothetical protein HAV23_14185 [Deinococcus radiodurans]QIP33245.1 hypothetical protein HAV35_13810 [Deinococcus radiodurans]UID71693.1 hypothetical protein DRO_A0104 [Deinococcus radiodurans R1 = ATCC 13939 = DSM 20539]UTA52190.1 hypothetical protein MSS93_16445 [Deinococcus radiodurans]
MSDFHIGDNNAVRFAIVPKGTSARPATAAFFSLPNVTTSDAPISASSVTKKYYKTNGGTATRGTGATVTFTVSGDLPQDKALREPVYRLRKAILNGDQIYLERAFDEEAPAAEWEGGFASLTNAALPSPSDNATTYSFTAGISGELKGPHQAAPDAPSAPGA